jgi:hypothetical protein
MVRLLSGLALLLLVAALPLPSVAATGPISCDYEAQGSAGALTIQNAAGLPYCAFGSAGNVVSAGVVTSPLFMTPVIGAAPGPLAVRIGEIFFSTGDRNAMWE